MEHKDQCQIIADELGLHLVQVINTIEMLDAGNTVPFITRYRKEKTGSLDENQIRGIEERIKYLRTLEERKQTILKSIKEQGKLTDELKNKITATLKMQELEDLYLPFRPKKRTRATVAKERGLEPLAQLMMQQQIHSQDKQTIASEYLDPEKEVDTAEAALAGARDILAEIFSENADIRKKIREYTMKRGFLVSKTKSDKADRVYELYFDYTQPLKDIAPHRMLAINRGEKEGALKVALEVEKDDVINLMKSELITNPDATFTDDLHESIADAYQRLISPAIHREIRTAITTDADAHAIAVFAVNLKKLLMQPPLVGTLILGIDPGFRTGCKVAVISETGSYLEGDTIYPHPPQKEYFAAKTRIRELVDKYNVPIIAIGNGTASRETELMVAELIKEVQADRKLVYHIVNEAGASVYSASQIAQEEFPELEASMRGNISIARRLQDPLAELVKIDPKSVGVGLYQHDVNQKSLKEELHNVVESCVNNVGVDLNTASAPLLRYVSGINEKTARNIVAHRNKIGRFSDRQQLLDVSGLGSAAFQQCAGFLKIRDGDNALDATSIHPESYAVTHRLLARFDISDIHKGGQKLKQQITEQKVDLQKLAQEIDCGQPTLEDILADLEKPGRDPRESESAPVFRSDVLKMEDLKPGMQIRGTVRNVVDFGVFVDIGVKQDGLIHVSEMADKYVKSPYEIVGVGDVVNVRVLSVDIERGRIGLSMKQQKAEPVMPTPDSG